MTLVLQVLVTLAAPIADASFCPAALARVEALATEVVAMLDAVVISPRCALLFALCSVTLTA
jgi:hypothetical protein